MAKNYFSSRSQKAITKQLLATKDLIRFFRKECGVYAYICYGTLLGAVRNHDVIPHDTDIDIAYLSKGKNIKEVKEESIRIAKILLKHGLLAKVWTPSPLLITKNTKEIEALTGQMHVYSPKRDAIVDVFTSWIENGKYYLCPLIQGQVCGSNVVPFKRGIMKYIGFVIPKNSTVILEYVYGEDWKIPIDKKPKTTRKWLTQYYED